MGLHCFGDFDRHTSSSPLGYVLLFVGLAVLAWLIAG